MGKFCRADKLDEADWLLDILADLFMLGVEKLILRLDRLFCCSGEVMQSGCAARAWAGKLRPPGRIRCSATSPGPRGEVGDSECGVEEVLALELRPELDRPGQLASRRPEPDLAIRAKAEEPPPPAPLALPEDCAMVT